MAQKEWLSKLALTWPHTFCFWQGEDIVCYTLTSIRWNNKKIKYPGILTEKHQKLDLTKIRLHSTRAKRKRCHDITLSRHGRKYDAPPGECTALDRPGRWKHGTSFLMFGGPVCAGRISNCQLDINATKQEFVQWEMKQSIQKWVNTQVFTSEGNFGIKIWGHTGHDPGNLYDSHNTLNTIPKNSIRDARTPQPWEIFSTPWDIEVL